MNTILVWVLVTVGGYNSSEVNYSPPLADLTSCQRLLDSVAGMPRRAQCVQISVPKP